MGGLSGGEGMNAPIVGPSKGGVAGGGGNLS